MSAKASLGQVGFRKLVLWNALPALVLSACVQSSPARAQTSSTGTKPKAGHVQLKPMLTGTDGSVTGTANFQGNYTTITAPGNQLVSLALEPD